MPRPRKPVSLLEARGTYRKDRHQERKQNEEKMKDLVSPIKEIEVPEIIQDQYVKDYWKYHTQFLIRLNELQLCDLPDLTEMYLALQTARKFDIEIHKIEEKGITENLEMYSALQNARLKQSRRFTELASKYYISPQARTKLSTDKLVLEDLKEKKGSYGASLLKRSK